MRIKELTINDISSKSLLFYDEQLTDACHGVCNYLNIDNLPIVGSSAYAERINGKFEIRPIVDSNRVSPHGRLIDKNIQVLLHDAKHNVLFVMDGGVVCGVVHISDLNRNSVIHAVQQDMLVFERNLRQFLLLNRVVDADLLKFMKLKADDGDKYYYSQFELFDQRIQKNGGMPGQSLQSFYLSHLLDFCNSSVSGKIFETKSTVNLPDGSLKDARSIICDLRNTAMHAKDMVNKESGFNIYSLENMMMFFRSLDVFIYYNDLLFQKIAGHESHIRAVKLDNESKLNIIMFQYPNAIEYFLK